MNPINKNSRLHTNTSGLSKSQLKRIHSVKQTLIAKVGKRQYTTLPFTEKPVAEGNFDSNRKPIKGVTIHTTDGGLNGSLAWFNNPASVASSNYMIDIDGTIYALLEEYYVPYTNGNYPSNQESITIENVDNEKPNDPRDERQVKANVLLTREILFHYGLPINRDTIKGHREVPPGTHPECPGSMPLDRIAKEAAGEATSPLTNKVKLDKVKAILSSTRTEEKKVVDIRWVVRVGG